MSRSFICLFLTSFSIETFCLPMWLHIVVPEIELPSNACSIVLKSLERQLKVLLMLLKYDGKGR